MLTGFLAGERFYLLVLMHLDLASKVQMLEQIATDAVAAGRESNAIGAIQLLNELVGFGAGQKP